RVPRRLVFAPRRNCRRGLPSRLVELSPGPTVPGVWIVRPGLPPRGKVHAHASFGHSKQPFAPAPKPTRTHTCPWVNPSARSSRWHLRGGTQAGTLRNGGEGNRVFSPALHGRSRWLPASGSRRRG